MDGMIAESPVESKHMTELLNALTALKRGKTGIRLPSEWTGISGRVADAFNEVVEMNERMAYELAKLNRTVGREGRINQRLFVGTVSGFWDDSVTSVNELIDQLIHPTTETARVIGAVAKGDLTQTMALEVDGRPLRGKVVISVS